MLSIRFFHIHNLTLLTITVIFYKVDVDANSDAAKEAGIACMPTFKYYKGGSEVDKLEGANIDMVKEMIEKNM